MADPLSIAGLATGVISLGLQVAGGLTDYLDAVRGRSEDLKSAKQEATEMRDLLLTIQDLLPQVESNWPASATMVKRHVKSCHTELGALHALLSELSQPGPSGSGLRSRLVDTRKKLSYPFERSKINRLEERLAKVNSALQMALQVTELNVSITSANQIREVHSLVVSLSQSQTSLRTQSVGACLSLATAREIPGVTNRGPSVPLDSIETAMSLASKPSLLSSSIKALEQFNVIQPPSRDLSQVCLCRPSRKMVQHRWGHLSFSYQTSSTRRHLPGCPLSQINGETQASKFTVEYFGLSKLFQTAFALSLMNTRGAGGQSISPGFTYYPTVNEPTAPAFRVMYLVAQFMRLNANWNEAAIRTVHCCYDTVFKLYREKKASPKDITLDGASLMHLIRVIFYWSNPLIADASFQMVMNLVACGVPANTYDEFGETPGIALLLGGPNETGLVVDLAKRLLPEPDIPLVSERALYRKDIKHLKLILEDSVIAEASGCGPLSLAARAGDERLVRELIKKYPQSLKEVNDFEDTPLHLAIKHPSCLRLILEAGGSLMLEQLEAEAWDWTPLACACRLGCRASAQILLATGSRINEFCIIHGHESCLDDVLAALKQRRDEIKLLALEHLTQAEAKGFGLHEEKVLDGCALEVQRLLLERGVHVPPRLCDGLYYPVYFLAYSTPLFDKLWALGFRDVNSCNKFGDMPLTRYRFDVEKARWLIEHGADYWTPFYERSSSTDISNITATPAHFLCCRVGLPYQLYGEHSDEYYKRVKTSQWLVEKLIQVQVTDACSCPCFGGGCTPLKGFFDQLRDYRNLTNIQDLARWCVGLTRTFLASFGEEDLITALRRMTFDGLGLTHTCCNLWNDIQRYHESFYTLEEVEEINSEQRPLLTLFNNLLVEFDQVAHEDQDGLPLIVHDPEEFWVHRWLPRMEETLDGLNGDDITAEERSAAEAVGVKWDLQPLKEVEEEEEEDWTPEYVMERLKKILDE